MATQRVQVAWTGSEQREAARKAQFEAVFREQWPRIHGLLARLVGDGDEAQDLALEAFWRLYSQPPSEFESGNVTGWLCRVATHLGLNSLRANKRRRQYESDSAALAAQEKEPPGSAPAEQVLMAGEQVALVRRALAEISPDHAELLLLRHSGLSYKELGQTYKLSPNSIGPLLVRAEREFERAYQHLTADD